MKLLNKTTLFMLIPTIILVGICSIIQYNIVHSQTIQRVDKQLKKERVLIEQQLKDLTSTAETEVYKTLKSDIEIVAHSDNKEATNRFFFVKAYDPEEEDEIQTRVYEFTFYNDHNQFLVTIKKPMAEIKAFFNGIVLGNTILLGLILLLSIYLNRFIAKKTWQPFYSTLKKLQQFNIRQPEAIQLENSNIMEFKLLNLEIDTLLKKVTKDYNAYKNFIENVSHELQTPIAIAKSKVDLIIQSPLLQEKEHELLSSIIHNLNRLSKLNQSLILLLKIENNIFNEKTSVNFNLLIYNGLKNFEDFIELKDLELMVNLDEEFIADCNDLLAEILVDNLIKNAVKHNVQGGRIKIQTHPEKLVIENTGRPLKTKPEFLFERFRTESDSGDSTGLGLSIIHQICKSNGLSVKYANKGDLHTLEIKS